MPECRGLRERVSEEIIVGKLFPRAWPAFPWPPSSRKTKWGFPSSSVLQTRGGACLSREGEQFRGAAAGKAAGRCARTPVPVGLQRGAPRGKTPAPQTRSRPRGELRPQPPPRPAPARALVPAGAARRAGESFRSLGRAPSPCPSHPRCALSRVPPAPPAGRPESHRSPPAPPGHAPAGVRPPPAEQAHRPRIRPARPSAPTSASLHQPGLRRDATSGPLWSQPPLPGATPTLTSGRPPPAHSAAVHPAPGLHRLSLLPAPCRGRPRLRSAPRAGGPLYLILK